MRTIGVVLCGGRSSRMGRDKAWLPVGDETMLQRVVRIVGEAVDEARVVAAEGQHLPALPTGVRVLRDPQPEQGPLLGLATALNDGPTRAYVSSCDLPHLTAGFITRVFAGLGDAEACVPVAGGRRHPLAAAYRGDILPIVHELLQAGERRLSALLDRLTVSELTLCEGDPDAACLTNVNTPDDYTAVTPALPRVP